MGCGCEKNLEKRVCKMCGKTYTTNSKGKSTLCVKCKIKIADEKK